MSSAAVVIGALRVKAWNDVYGTEYELILNGVSGERVFMPLGGWGGGGGWGGCLGVGAVGGK